MSEHIDVRRKIKDIATIDRFEKLISAAAITDKDRQLMRMWYIEDQDFNFIGDCLGYSESGAKRRHSRILKKIAALPPEYF